MTRGRTLKTKRYNGAIIPITRSGDALFISYGSAGILAIPVHPRQYVLNGKRSGDIVAIPRQGALASWSTVGIGVRHSAGSWCEARGVSWKNPEVSDASVLPE